MQIDILACMYDSWQLIEGHYLPRYLDRYYTVLVSTSRKPLSVWTRMKMRRDEVASHCIASNCTMEID